MAVDGKILQFRKNCLGFPGSSAGKESICNARETGLFLCQEVPLEKGEATHYSVLFLWWLRHLRICLQCGSSGFNPWVWRPPEGGLGNPLQHSCLENPHGQRSLVDSSPWGRKELLSATKHPHSLKTLFEYIFYINFIM